MRLSSCSTLLFVFSALLFAQTKPEFEVASVRLVPPSENPSLDSYMPTLDIAPGSTLRISNRRLDEIIMLAYDVGVKQLVGPKWLTEPTTDPSVITRFEILAKIPADAKKSDIPLMLQRMLEDRFKLQAHREQRPTQVYSLEVGKNGSKLQPSVPNDKRTPGCNRVIGGGTDGAVLADCYNVTAVQFAQQLQTLAPGIFRDGPVVDRTGLTGAFDVRLEWMMQQQLDAGMDGPTMYQAVERLGLKLEKKQQTAEVLVVDRCEQTPTEN